MTWQDFVLRHGAGARAEHLAHVLGITTADVHRFKSAHVMGGMPKRRPTFLDLFQLKHGRPPRESEWPVPTRGAGGGYEWLPPEVALLVRLVGRVGKPEISRVLTARLRKLSGDRDAKRDLVAVQDKISLIGLQQSELLGGLTTSQAGRELRRRGLGSLTVVQQAVHTGRLRTFRVGHRHVIPRAALEAFAAKRDRAPEGYVRLTVLQKPLGIASDSKLPEAAGMGYIPGAVKVRCSNLWMIPKTVADTIIAAARSGRPLPWHGRPWPVNVKGAWKKWRRRRHRWCRACSKAWGHRPPPKTFEEFTRRYPPLDIGVKRHLTRKRSQRAWNARRPWGSIRAFRGRGITPREASIELGRTLTWVWGQIRRGVCRPVRCSWDPGQPVRIPPAGMAKLRKARGDELRGRPPGTWLGVHAAAARAGVSVTQISIWRRRGRITSKRGARGWLHGLTSIERIAREYWRAPRYKRATPPTWIQEAA